MKPFTEKYKPKSLEEVKGQSSATFKLKSAVENKTPVLIYGSTGIGKTASVYALANELNYEILEVNASDLRNKQNILDMVGNALNQRSLFEKGKIILVDEIDGLSGKEDYGGIPALASLLSQKNIFIALTANDPFASSLVNIRKKVVLIEFRKPTYLTIASILKNICEKENINYNEEKLRDISLKAGGDIRAAINDLQSVCYNSEIQSCETIGNRNQEESIFNALKLIFKSKELEVLGAFDNVNMDLDLCFLWLDENLGLEYSGDALIKAYDSLSKANVYRGRIRRNQHWRFLVYMNNLMTAGIAFSKKEKNPNFVGYKRVSRILKLWKAKTQNTKRNSIAQKLASKSHTSIKQAIKELNYLKPALKNEEVAKYLNLSDDEISWIRNG